MKKLPYLFIILFIISCDGLPKIFNSGTIENANYIEVIPFNYDNNFALIDVLISGKTYNFLVDTGAPTVISNKIYKDLNIKPAKNINVSDSQGQSNKQQIVIVPQIQLGDLVYKDIGAVVVDLRDVFEYNCMNIDGIIGANQMAKSYWKFDYRNQESTITNKLENYNLKTYEDSLKFYTSAQKTPKVKGVVNGKTTTFTFDTGFAGNIDVAKSIDDFNNAMAYNTVGSSSVGLYDARDSVNTKTIKADSLRLSKIEIGPQVVDLDHGSLIGNDFMNKHDLIIDWTNHYIYLNKLTDYEPATESSFGFGFRYIDNKAMVVALIKELPIDLQLGDQLLAIHDKDLRNLDNNSSCEVFNLLKLSKLDSIDITYLRDQKEYNTTLTKVMLIK